MAEEGPQASAVLHPIQTCLCLRLCECDVPYIFTLSAGWVEKKKVKKEMN